MSTRVSQPAENFDSTAKLMLEALAKASAELEKSVTAFTEQLISFNESLQKSLDEELRSVNGRMENAIRINLEDLAHNKHLMVKRLLEAERAEIESLAGTGREVRSTVSRHALQIEERIEEFINDQIAELKEFLEQPKRSIETVTNAANEELQEQSRDATAEVKNKQEELRRRLSDKVSDLERSLRIETEAVKASMEAAGADCRKRLSAQKDVISSDLQTFTSDTTREMEKYAEDALKTLEERERGAKTAIKEEGEQWRQQITGHCEGFDKMLAGLSSVLKENYETKLANASEQARQEITLLSDQAHEKITATRGELEVELRDLEKDYLTQFDNVLKKLEAIVSENVSDKRNSGMARQHKVQKLRDQMQNHLKRFGTDLVDTVKDASDEFEAEFDRATEGFHTRIEGARSSAIELLERESRLMQKDIERTMKEFQKELTELEAQIGQIEKAGQDAALTVIACRKAVLSFRGE